MDRHSFLTTQTDLQSNISTPLITSPEPLPVNGARPPIDSAVLNTQLLAAPVSRFPGTSLNTSRLIQSINNGANNNANNNATTNNTNTQTSPQPSYGQNNQNDEISNVFVSEIATLLAQAGLLNLTGRGGRLFMSPFIEDREDDDEDEHDDDDDEHGFHDYGDDPHDNDDLY